MKKLNKLVLNKAKIMSAPQMKYITGGYDGRGGTCAAKSASGQVHCNLYMEEAKHMGAGGNWCCDHCYTASWYNC